MAKIDFFIFISIYKQLDAEVPAELKKNIALKTFSVNKAVFFFSS